MSHNKPDAKASKVDEARSERVLVSPHDIGGRLKATASDAEVILVWNVSEQGLCVWTASKLMRGEKVVFEMERPWSLIMRGEVRWCRRVPERSGYLVGLVIFDHQEELARLSRSLSEKKAQTA